MDKAHKAARRQARRNKRLRYAFESGLDQKESVNHVGVKRR